LVFAKCNSSLGSLSRQTVTFRYEISSERSIHFANSCILNAAKTILICHAFVCVLSRSSRARTHIHWILIDCNSLFYPNSAIRKREPESHGGASPDLGAAEKPTSTTSHRINYDVNDNNDDDDNDNDNDNCHDADLAIDTADYRGGYPGQPGTSTTATIAAVDRQCVITNGDA